MTESFSVFTLQIMQELYSEGLKKTLEGKDNLNVLIWRKDAISFFRSLEDRFKFTQRTVDALSTFEICRKGRK